MAALPPRASQRPPPAVPASALQQHSPAPYYLVAVVVLLSICAVGAGRYKPAALPFVFKGGATLIALFLGLLAFSAPLWVSVVVGFGGLVFIVGDTIFGHSAEAKIHRRLDVLDKIEESGKSALFERLYQVQSDVHCLTRAYHVRKSELGPEIIAEQHEQGISARAELERLEQDAAFEFHTKYVNSVYFIVNSIERYGFGPNVELRRLLDGGPHDAKGLDRVAYWLHELIMEVHSRDW